MRNLAFVTAILCLAAAAFAEIKTQAIAYTHDGVELEGYLAYDDAIDDPAPGVLVIHEWWGLNDYAMRRARQLAEMGYVAFCADMYGRGKVTADPKQAGQWAGHMSGNLDLWRSRALRGLEILRGREECDADRVAAIGYCFGGSTVTHLAFANAPLRGVVSFHGSMPIPPAVPEKVEPQVLICHGAEDDFAKPDHVQKFKDTLDAGNADWTCIEYSNAVHSFTNPGADAHGMDGVGYNARADQQSWAHMKAFFDRVLGK